MRYSSQPIGSDEDRRTSTDIPDVFSDGAADGISASEPGNSGDQSEVSDDDSILDNEEEEQELSTMHYLQEAQSLSLTAPTEPL
ncbi:hypothetical protein Asppvi_010734 [Aspergillus pseudoviridinutans]|uniref:Uncharacterized protein n=1 Tax=Aspergillus pseudoviridinutans TaxID=1517512 RepID=A0A9P3BQ84_9EURO|nr:uncharacterized protein Asppvi_010734 [Aspergillus pseudoviridinutans]GIJ91761.1 hypothetical protein Asppvi_010734 [Aspergillus pseudoviridinutans]